jgi:hypothetical protein
MRDDDDGYGVSPLPMFSTMAARGRHALLHGQVLESTELWIASAACVTKSQLPAILTERDSFRGTDDFRSRTLAKYPTTKYS